MHKKYANKMEIQPVDLKSFQKRRFAIIIAAQGQRPSAMKNAKELVSMSLSFN